MLDKLEAIYARYQEIEQQMNVPHFQHWIYRRRSAA